MGTVQTTYKGYNASIHDGALLGSNSLFVRIRNESVGVFTLSNDDRMGIPWYEAVYPLIMDDLLGIMPEEGEGDKGDSREDAPASSESPYTPQPADPRPSPDISAYIGGTFAAPGYEPFTLSTVNLSDGSATWEAQIPYEFLRGELITLFPTLNITLEGPALYTPWNQTLAEFIFFTHFDGPMYNATVLMSFDRLPPGMISSERDTGYIGKFTGSATAVFTEGGIGFFDGFWGKANTVGNRPAVEEDVEASAEVFFSWQ